MLIWNVDTLGPECFDLEREDVQKGHRRGSGTLVRLVLLQGIDRKAGLESRNARFERRKTGRPFPASPRDLALRIANRLFLILPRTGNGPEMPVLGTLPGRDNELG